jgi:glycosyltransferase involved in cell wall biosynthesis
MPAYNAEKYIIQSIESVLAQSFSGFELIIIDDCSTDNTFDIVSSFAERDSRIKCFKSEINSGVANARNRGISLSRGSWIAFIDSDDLWLPQKLEHQLKMVCENDADLIYCSYSMVDESGTRVCNDFIVPERIDFESLILENVIGCSTVVVKSNIFKKYSFLSHVYHEDYALWLDILNAGYKAIGDKSIMVQYCVRGDSRSSGKIKCAYYRWKIYRKHLNLSFFKSVRALFGYATAGFKKYKKT